MPNKLDFLGFKYMQIINIKLRIFRNLNLVLVIYHWSCFFRQFWSIGHDFCSLNFILLYASIIWLIFQVRVICLVGYRTTQTQVAEKLMIMHEECLEGNFKSIESLRKVSVPHVRQVGIRISNSWPKSCPLPKSSSLNLYDGQIIEIGTVELVYNKILNI